MNTGESRTSSGPTLPLCMYTAPHPITYPCHAGAGQGRAGRDKGQDRATLGQGKDNNLFLIWFLLVSLMYRERQCVYYNMMGNDKGRVWENKLENNNNIDNNDNENNYNTTSTTKKIYI